MGDTNLGKTMKRAVITGMGVVSPLGNNIAETLTSLKETKSGIGETPWNSDFLDWGKFLTSFMLLVQNV